MRPYGYERDPRACSCCNDLKGHGRSRVSREAGLIVVAEAQSPAEREEWDELAADAERDKYVERHVRGGNEIRLTVRLPILAAPGHDE